MVRNTDGTRPVRFEGLVILFMNSSFPQAACDRVTLGLGFEMKTPGQHALVYPSIYDGIRSQGQPSGRTHYARPDRAHPRYNSNYGTRKLLL